MLSEYTPVTWDRDLARRAFSSETNLPDIIGAVFSQAPSLSVLPLSLYLPPPPCVSLFS